MTTGECVSADPACLSGTLKQHRACLDAHQRVVDKNNCKGKQTTRVRLETNKAVYLSAIFYLTILVFSCCSLWLATHICALHIQDSSSNLAPFPVATEQLLPCENVKEILQKLKKQMATL